MKKNTRSNQKMNLFVPDRSGKGFKLNLRPALNLKKVSGSYDVRVWDEERARYSPRDSLSKLIIDQGRVSIDGQMIVKPSFERYGLLWSERTSKGFIAGVLHFSHDGLSFSGSVHIGENETNCSVYHVIGAVPQTVYESEACARDAQGCTDWQKGITVTIGYYFDDEGFLQPIILLNDHDATAFAGLTINKTNNNLVLNIPTYIKNYVKDYLKESPQWPTSGSIEFSYDEPSNKFIFSGWLKRIDPATGEESKSTFAWRGTARQTAVRLKAPAKPEKLLDQGLSVIDLMGISPERVQDLAFNMLVMNMKWAMNDEWRSDFFNEAKPDLDKSRTDLINQDLDFYQNKFSVAYLGYATKSMKGDAAPSVPLTHDEFLKLDYYLERNLAGEPGYIKQSHGIFMQAFLANSPRLQDYITDGGDKWAKELLKYLTSDVQINQMWLRFIVDPGLARELVTRYSNILAALQPLGDAAVQYNNHFIMRSAVQLIDDANLDNKDDIMEWLPDIIEAFVTKYLTTGDPELRNQLEMAQALEEAKQHFGSYAQLASELADAFLAVPKGELEDRLIAANKEFVDKHPKLLKAAKAAGFLRAGLWMMGLQYAITGLMNWDKLRADKKADVVLTLISVFQKMISSIPEILSTTGALTGSIFKAARWLLMKFKNLRIMEGKLAELDGEWLSKMAKNIKGFFDKATKAITTEGKLLSKLFKGISVSMKWIGVIVSGAFAVLSTIAFILDFTQQGSIQEKVLDGITMVCDILSTVCLVIGLFVATTVMAVASAIFVGLGFIASLIMMFIPKPKPKPKIDPFMASSLRPFLSLQPVPPKDFNPIGG
jgi:hypothetical protein